jgi:hypothetical protein
MRLDDGQLGGGNVESVNISRKTSKRLLGTIGPVHNESLIQRAIFATFLPDESVDLDSVNIIQLLERSLDLPLVRLDIDNEDKGVVLLNLLHRALGVERVDDNLAGIEHRLPRDALAWVAGCARKSKGLWAVEGGVRTDFADLVRVDLWFEDRPSE